MEIKNNVPVLFVKDAQKSKNFYVDVLGMTVVGDFGGLNIIFKENFAIWQILEENMILQKLGSDKVYDASATSRFETAFETEDLDEVYNTLKSHNVKFLHEINEEIWGQRNLRFYDPDGHLIEVGEAMHVFLKRVYNEEKTVEGVAKRTFMEPDAVRHFLGL